MENKKISQIYRFSRHKVYFGTKYIVIEPIESVDGKMPVPANSLFIDRTNYSISSKGI